MTQPVSASHSQKPLFAPIPEGKEAELAARTQEAAAPSLKRHSPPSALSDTAPPVLKREKSSDPELSPFPDFFNPEARCWKELQEHFKLMFFKHQYRILEASNARTDKDGHLVLLREPTDQELQDADLEVLISTSLKHQIESFVNIVKNRISAAAIRFFLFPCRDFY